MDTGAAGDYINDDAGGGGGGNDEIDDDATVHTTGRQDAAWPYGEVLSVPYYQLLEMLDSAK